MGFAATAAITEFWAKCKSTFATVDKIYPVGSIYMSVYSTDPGELFGGEWTQLEDTFLLGAGSSYSVNHVNDSTPTIDGGEATHKHTTSGHKLTEEETPVHAHTHSFTKPTVSGGAVTDGITGGSHHHQLRRQASNKTLAKGTWGYDEGYVESGGGTITNGSATTDTTHKHNLPSHSHTVSGGSVGARAYPSGTSASDTTEHGHGDTGYGSSLPPYMVVYIWKRTA